MRNHHKEIVIGLSIFIMSSFFGPVLAQNPAKIRINNITLNDITNLPTTQKIQDSYVLAQTSDYQIVYMPKYNNEFLIDINSSTFSETRVQSQGKLIELLGISEHDACFLNIIISTSVRINPTEGLRNYRPSFCEQSLSPTPLPSSSPRSANSPDVNKDGIVNSIDYALVITKYGRVGTTIKEDINNDGVVNSLDLSRVIQALGQSAP